MSGVAARALAHWGMQDATCAFVAGRENRVYRVDSRGGTYALRIRRPGYRSLAELRSELDWLAALHDAGLRVPQPLEHAPGLFLAEVEGRQVDMIGWLQGAPLGATGTPLVLRNRTATFRALGAQIAQLHKACDGWAPPADFARLRWDEAGLVGDSPLWGRFWDNPTLNEDAKRLFTQFRDRARDHLSHLAQRDFGLIHGDLVRENILIDAGQISLIDFDDGGWGDRLFDVAGALIKNQDEADFGRLRDALVGGYRSIRPLDTTHMDLFMALRAVTYVGWIVPRMNEAGAHTRNRRFIAQAQALCRAYLGQMKAA